ncbi:hypothetical protein [Nautilia lithotrophica]
MKTILLVKNGELADYPADILVDGEVRKSYNLEFECEKTGAQMVIGKSMPSILIKKLRDNGIIFVKLNSLKDLEDLDIDVKLPDEFRNKRGWKCGKKGF